MPDLAPGWWVHCPKCGWCVPFGSIGGIRLGAWSWGKRILHRCPECRRLRWVKVNRTPPEDAAGLPGGGAPGVS